MHEYRRYISVAFVFSTILVNGGFVLFYIMNPNQNAKPMVQLSKIYASTL